MQRVGACWRWYFLFFSMQHVQLALAKMGMGAVGSRQQRVRTRMGISHGPCRRYQSTRQRGERVEALASSSGADSSTTDVCRSISGGSRRDRTLTRKGCVLSSFVYNLLKMHFFYKFYSEFVICTLKRIFLGDYWLYRKLLLGDFVPKLSFAAETGDAVCFLSVCAVI